VVPVLALPVATPSIPADGRAVLGGQGFRRRSRRRVRRPGPPAPVRPVVCRPQWLIAARTGREADVVPRPLVQPFRPARWPYRWRQPALWALCSLAAPASWGLAFELRQHFVVRLGLLPPATVWPIDENVCAMAVCLYVLIASTGVRWVYGMTLPTVDPRILRGLMRQ
jgi:hypothetical protein